MTKEPTAIQTSNPLQIVAPKRLTNAQRTLYVAIREKVATNSPLTLQEVVDMWVAVGCKNIRKGVPTRLEDMWVDGEWKSDYVPMSDDIIKSYAKQWLMRNIGTFVIKGYLKVLPTIDL